MNVGVHCSRAQFAYFNLCGYLNPKLFLRAQGVFLHVPGPRVSGADPQDGHDQRRRAHGLGAQPLLDLQPAYLRASMPLPPAGLELPQVSSFWYIMGKMAEM